MKAIVTGEIGQPPKPAVSASASVQKLLAHHHCRRHRRHLDTSIIFLGRRVE
jgi:hypothetical protein